MSEIKRGSSYASRGSRDVTIVVLLSFFCGIGSLSILDRWLSNNVSVMIIYAVSLLCVMLLFMKHRANFIHRYAVEYLRGYLPVILICATIIFSDMPDVTAVKSLHIAVLSTLVIAVSWSLGPRHGLNCLFTASSIAVWLSIAVFLIVPDLSLTKDDRGLSVSGVFIHKNVLGFVACLSLVGAMIGLSSSSSLGASIFSAINALLSITATVLTNSAGGWLLSISVVLAWFGLPFLIRRSKSPAHTITLLLSLLALIALAVYFGQELLLQLFGRDKTLTGRDEIWRLSLEYIRMRPIQGYGFMAFWGDGSRYSGIINQTLMFDVPHAHSMGLDLLLHLGIVGSILFIALIVRGVYATMCVLYERQDVDGQRLLLSLVIVAILSNLVESRLFSAPCWLLIGFISLNPKGWSRQIFMKQA